MLYYKIINEAIDYMEQHLTENMSHADIAGRIYLSVPHLYRVFHSMTGYTIGQYIRMRRLTEAANKLHHEMRILDIAVEHQFESQESFTRSFKTMFNITPGEYRRNPSIIPLFRRITLMEQQNAGGTVMQPRIETHKFTLVGLETEIDMSTDFTEVINALARELSAKLPNIHSVAHPPHVVNLWYPTFEEGSPLTAEPKSMFFTGVQVLSICKIPEGLILKDLPESLFAVFSEAQRGTVGGPSGYAYQTWLPASGYKLNEQLPGDLEVYKDITNIGYMDECKICIPIAYD